MSALQRWISGFVLASMAVGLHAQEPLPGTAALDALPPADRSAAMVAGIHRFLDRQIQQAVVDRPGRWTRDFSSREAYEKSIQPMRERLAKIIGAVEPRVTPVELRLDFTTDHASLLTTEKSRKVNVVSWPVVPGITAKGILVSPIGGELKAGIVLLPDADQLPLAVLAEAEELVNVLLANGCQILIPTLINRDSSLSGNEKAGRWTNLPHREWIYRQGFDLGRHLIGYEVQEALAAVDWFEAQSDGPKRIIGCIGYGEGGLLALYAAALDTRIKATLVSGYFAPREELWREPISRNLFEFAQDFGDAELAAMIFPRALVIEHSEVPEITGLPPMQRDRAAIAAPGTWRTPDGAAVTAEVDRALALVAGAPEDWTRPELLAGPGGAALSFGSKEATHRFLERLFVEPGQNRKLPMPIVPSRLVNADWYNGQRIHNAHLREIEAHLQQLLHEAASERDWTFWQRLAANPAAARAEFTRQFKYDVIGWFDDPRLPLAPRSRELERTGGWTAHEIQLGVWEDVFAWGYLLLPNDLQPGEKRPVVVCQHGLEGLPGDVIERDETSRAWKAYKGFGAMLADRGYIVFAPHNPYRGGNAFRDLQRKLNPLGRSLFSVIGRQHEAILDWLVGHPNVDAERIGFYGLSYGGKSAMRLPVLEPRYALSICSGDFNEWVWKNSTVDWRGSYVYAPEHEIFEWDLGHTFNYAEMAALIAPRPFMVERGHRDGVGLDEWVAFEYARVRRYYADLKIPERTEIEWFDGPHTIHGVGTVEFLQKWLGR